MSECRVEKYHAWIVSYTLCTSQFIYYGHTIDQVLAYMNRVEGNPTSDEETVSRQFELEVADVMTRPCDFVYFPILCRKRRTNYEIVAPQLHSPFLATCITDVWQSDLKRKVKSLQQVLFMSFCKGPSRHL